MKCHWEEIKEKKWNFDGQVKRVEIIMKLRDDGELHDMIRTMKGDGGDYCKDRSWGDYSCLLQKRR